MSVLSSRALHEQLSVIMGALTKAAVAEICELVDEGYAVLQMEITRSHKENEDLKKKLLLIESIVVRGSSGPCAAAHAAAHAAAEGMDPAPSADKLLQPDASPRQRNGERGDAAAASGGHGGAAGAEREQVPEVVLIKDEDSDSNDTEDEGAERGPARGGATSAAMAGQRRSSCRTEDSEKLSDQMDVMTSATATQAKLSVYALDAPPGRLGCSSQLVEGVPAEGGESSCSFSSQMYFSSSALMEAQSPSSRAELDLSVESVWSKQPKGSVAFGSFVPNDSGDAFGLKVVSISGSSPADGHLSDSRSSVFDCDTGAVSFGLFGDQAGPPQLAASQPGANVHRKRFICSICNKTYANTQNLEVHMRIHTGERPFCCSQCGKKFTQSAHLKSHLNVHSGERPYTCKLCSKSFMIKYSLKLHMKKSHPSS